MTAERMNWRGGLSESRWRREVVVFVRDTCTTLVVICDWEDGCFNVVKNTLSRKGSFESHG